jgi:DNA-binding winged helix-turn-helix (wHTH) protein/tetratricopeptide (TPR) repeat protein
VTAAILTWDRIDLSQTPDLSVGPLMVRPRLREVRSKSQTNVLEPRVMRVMVALAERPGEIVGYEELIERCWDGRVIGDNAVHRVIGKLREMLSALEPGGAVAIETVAKVGYRLVQRGGEDVATAPALSPPAAEARRLPALTIRLLALLIMAVGLGALALHAWRGRASGDLRIAVTAHDDATAALARDLRGELAAFAASRPRQPMTILDATAADTDVLSLIIRADRRRGGRIALDITDNRSGSVVWATVLDSQEAMAPRLAAMVTPVLACLARPAVRRERLDLSLRGSFLAACQRFGEIPDHERLRLLDQVVERRPNFLLARAELAYAQAFFAGAGEAPESERERLRQAAAAHVAAAGSRDPTLGAVHLARNQLTARSDLRARLQTVEQGLQAAPDDARLHDEHAHVLSSLGRMADALESARRAVELEPYSPRSRNAFITALAYMGYVEAARAELERAARIWPQSQALRDIGFRFHLRYGDPAVALRILADGHRGMAGPTDMFSHMAEALAVARQLPTPENIQAALDSGRISGGWAPGAPFWRLQALGHFDRVDEALAMMADPAVAPQLRGGPEVLFRHHMRSVWLDPRFMRVMHEIGLVDLWRETGRWPDFCRDALIRYNCRQEAERLLATGPRSRPTS